MVRLSREVELRCFPRNDRAFAEAVQRAVTEYRSAPTRGDPPIEAIQLRLREAYPLVEIHAREPIAEPLDIVEPAELWYVYRDGRLIT